MQCVFSSRYLIPQSGALRKKKSCLCHYHTWNTRCIFQYCLYVSSFFTDFKRQCQDQIKVSGSKPQTQAQLLHEVFREAWCNSPGGKFPVEAEGKGVEEWRQTGEAVWSLQGVQLAVSAARPLGARASPGHACKPKAASAHYMCSYTKFSSRMADPQESPQVYNNLTNISTNTKTTASF